MEGINGKALAFTPNKKIVAKGFSAGCEVYFFRFDSLSLFKPVIAAASSGFISNAL